MLTSSLLFFKITIYFQTVDVEESVGCESDKLTIDDGIRKEKICGNLKAKNNENK